jgi:hypothetical protein
MFAGELTEVCAGFSTQIVYYFIITYNCILLGA